MRGSGRYSGIPLARCSRERSCHARWIAENDWLKQNLDGNESRKNRSRFFILGFPFFGKIAVPSEPSEPSEPLVNPIELYTQQSDSMNTPVRFFAPVPFLATNRRKEQGDYKDQQFVSVD